MERVKTASALLRDPIGHYVVGGSLAIWVQHAERIGMFHTASAVDRADHPMLVEAFPLPTSPLLAPRYDLLHDLATVDRLDQSAFTFFEGFLAQSVEAIAHRVRRLAVVRPPGLAGAAVAGMYDHWVAPRFDARLCDSRHDAYEFLRVSSGDRQVLDALSDGAATVTLRRVRDHLARDLVSASLDRLAARIGTSVRSLQRVLTSHATTFRDELARVRIQLAESRLLESDDKIEVIGRDLGFSSAPAFVRMFERATGCSPHEFRRRARSR